MLIILMCPVIVNDNYLIITYEITLIRNNYTDD